MVEVLETFETYEDMPLQWENNGAEYGDFVEVEEGEGENEEMEIVEEMTI